MDLKDVKLAILMGVVLYFEVATSWCFDLQADRGASLWSGIMGGKTEWGMYVYLKLPLSKALKNKYDILGELLFSYPQSDEKINLGDTQSSKTQRQSGEKQPANSVKSGKVHQNNSIFTL